jgi:hypothetical protein
VLRNVYLLAQGKPGVEIEQRDGSASERFNKSMLDGRQIVAKISLDAGNQTIKDFCGVGPTIQRIACQQLRAGRSLGAAAHPLLCGGIG